MIFINDILIYSKDEEGHASHLRVALETLRKEKLYEKLSKREFWLRKVTLFGHIILEDEVSVDHRKTEAIRNWTIPKSVTEIRSFLRLVVYY